MILMTKHLTVRVPKSEKIEFYNVLNDNKINCTLKRGAVEVDGRSLIGVMAMDLEDGVVMSVDNLFDETLISRWLA